jgi:hypothetical protein
MMLRLAQLALGRQPITKREECQPANGVPEDAAAFRPEDLRDVNTVGAGSPAESEVRAQVVL